MRAFYYTHFSSDAFDVSDPDPATWTDASKEEETWTPKAKQSETWTVNYDY
jgi:hypothetical protein